jgi:hypothetical protein
MAMIVLSSPATLTGSEEKKTGPSRFRPLFFDRIYKMIKIQNLPARIHSVYTKFTASLHESDTDYTLSLHQKYTQ